MSKAFFFLCSVVLILDFCGCWVINDINTAMLMKDAFDNDISGDEFDDENNLIQPRIDLIYPGTKWCGAGNVADNYDDLGPEKEADMCCRAHDLCPDLIPGGGTKHNLTNNAFYTRLSCKCDDQFRDCLRSANTRVAKYIGIVYFDALLTKCFKEDYPVIKCNKKGGWFKTKCVEYLFDKNGTKVYQWFDVKAF